MDGAAEGANADAAAGGQDTKAPDRTREGRPGASRGQAQARPADAAAPQSPSLISRLGARLRKLVTRAPQSQH